jgi:hypothetical protein
MPCARIRISILLLTKLRSSSGHFECLPPGDGDGRLTDVTGRTVDFTNLIFIATSNAGTNYFQDRTGQGATAEEIKNELLEKELRPNFRPVF